MYDEEVKRIGDELEKRLRRYNIIDGEGPTLEEKAQLVISTLVYQAKVASNWLRSIGVREDLPCSITSKSREIAKALWETIEQFGKEIKL